MARYLVGMTSRLRFFPLVGVLCGLLVAPLTASAETGAQRVERLLNAMGGREAWAAVETVIVEATHYSLTPPNSYANRIVNDLVNFRVLFEAHSANYDRWLSISGETGTYRRDDEPIIPARPDQIAENATWWSENVYRTLRRLAVGDAGLEPRAVGEDRLEIHTPEGRLNWFRLTTGGAPALYGIGPDSEATIFGPLRDHPSGIRYPGWGAGDLGAWRYEIEKFYVNPPITKADFEIPSPSNRQG